MEEKTESTLISEDKPTAIDTLFKLYKKNRYHARVFYKNSGKHQFIRRSTWLYEEGNNFSIVQYRKIHGISVTNKMYNRETAEIRLTYKNGKFWFINKTGNSKGVRHFTLSHIQTMNNTAKVFKVLIKKFPWIEFLMVNNLLTYISVNTIKSKKLFTLKKALKYKYKTNYPTAKLLNKCNNYFTKFDLPKKMKYLKNVESIKEDWLQTSSATHNYFYDSLRMAETLDRQVNCSWSNSRLKQEHDKWSNEITEIIYKECNRDLKISNIFLEFRDFSNLNMLTTTKEMFLEGKKQSHCVGTYINKVDTGSCAIFTFDKFTIEISKKLNNQLYIVQCRGFKNKDADEQTMSHINKFISEFNKITQSKRVKNIGINTNNILSWFEDVNEEHPELPF